MQGFISMHIFPNNMEPGEQFSRLGVNPVVVVGVVGVAVLIVVTGGGVQVYRLNLPPTQ
jgi:hypothetical protein